MGKKGKKSPAHQMPEKKFLLTRNHPPPPPRVKWSAPKGTGVEMRPAIKLLLGLLLGTHRKGK